MSDPRAPLIENVRLQAVACKALGSSFYEALLGHIVNDIAAAGPCWEILAAHAGAPADDVYSLRLLAGVHRVVLSGGAPALTARYPSTGGDGDAEAAWPDVRRLIADPPPSVLDALTRPPQTNEVGRSIPLFGGLLVIAARMGLPLRLRELGASAGLNLRFDRYWFEQDGAGWGDAATKVRFTQFWSGARPLFERGLEIADRRGCDRDPIDATSDDGRLALLSYVWPDQAQRFQLLAAALEAALDTPVDIDRTDAGAWVERMLVPSNPGACTVVYHSVFWQYLPDATRSAIIVAIQAAGARATPEAPLAWLRLEPGNIGDGFAELRLSLWPAPGGVVDNELLAKAGFHLGPVEWLAGAGLD
ncbi:MAG TPA: DUF2332 family protein [Acidimicrobiia bacterium]|nr:DUF2332 family protein [Acidimicrobiia bacterium]